MLVKVSAIVDINVEDLDPKFVQIEEFAKEEARRIMIEEPEFYEFDYEIIKNPNMCGYADDYTYTAGAFTEDGFGYEDFSTYDDITDAVNFARNRHWDQVVCDQTGEVIWERGVD